MWASSSNTIEGSPLDFMAWSSVRNDKNHCNPRGLLMFAVHVHTMCPFVTKSGNSWGGIFVEGFNMGISSTSGGRPGSNDVSSWDSPKLIEHSGTLKLRGKEISSRTSWQKTLSMSCALTVVSLSGPLCHQHPAKCPYRGYRGSRKKMEKLFRDVYSTMFPPNFPAHLYGSMLLESY